MPDPDNDYVLIDSPLSCELKRDGITIEVCIYRGGDDPEWILEVVDQGGNSFVWEDHFATDQAAMDELLKTIQREGMKQFNPYSRRREH